MESELGRRIVVRSCRSDRLFRTAPSRQTVLRGSARLRRAVPTPLGELARGRRSRPSPRFFRGWRCAVSTASRRSMPVGDRRSVARAPRGSGVRGSRACAPPCPPGYAPRKEPSRRSGSTPPRPCGPLCRATGRTARRSAFQAVPALLLSRRYAVSTASRRSMPVGDRRSAVARAPRGSGVRGVSSRPRDSSRSAVRPPRRYAPRCRCEHRRPI